MYSLIASVIVSLTNMSNISVINWSSCLEFLGDYEIKSVEMKSGSGLSGEAIIRVLIDNEEYDWKWLIDWLDLPYLSTLKGVGGNFEWINKVHLDSDDWWLNLT